MACPDYYYLMEIPDKLRDFVNQQREPLSPLAHPDDPLELDSHGVIRLVAFLETDLGFFVPDDELIPANFENLGAIERMLNGQGKKMDWD